MDEHHRQPSYPIRLTVCYIAFSADSSVLAGFMLYLSNETMDNFTGHVPVYTQTGDYGNGVFNVTLGTVLTRYICVNLPSATAGLSICELRVFGGKINLHFRFMFTVSRCNLI